MHAARRTGALCALLTNLCCGGGQSHPDAAPAADASGADIGRVEAAAGPDAATIRLDGRARDGVPGLADLQGTWFEEDAPAVDGGVPQHRRLRVEGAKYFEVMNGSAEYCAEEGTLTAGPGTLSFQPMRTEGGCPPQGPRSATAAWTDTGIALTLPGRIARYVFSRRVPKVFVTVETHDGNFAADASLPGAHAIARADAFCNQSIARPDERPYKALIVDGVHRSAVPPQDWVLQPDTTYYQPDGVHNVFRTNSTSVSRSYAYNPLLSDQEANRYSWIGLAPGFKTGGTCDGWTSTDSTETGGMGDASERQFIFGFNVGAGCNSRQTLVCVSQ